jgi:hypothetical protein
MAGGSDALAGDAAPPLPIVATTALRGMLPGTRRYQGQDHSASHLQRHETMDPQLRELQERLLERFERIRRQCEALRDLFEQDRIDYEARRQMIERRPGDPVGAERSSRDDHRVEAL